MTVDEKNELIDKYRYGDNYALVWPYDEDMEAVMAVIEKIMIDIGYRFYIYCIPSSIFNTAGPEWEAEIGYVSGKGKSMKEACYNLIINHIKDIDEKAKKEAEAKDGEEDNVEQVPF